jgi:K+-sensing histidine kinase KdpD
MFYYTSFRRRISRQQLRVERAEDPIASVDEQRPDPDHLLQSLKRDEERETKGRLKIFFGMCAGVGKTYDMLKILHNAAVHAAGATDIMIVAHVEQNECVIIVSDNGQGIPPADMDKVFGKFYRIQGTRSGGTGLGLSIARGIVTAHGGTISCANRPGGGAQFILRLPLGTPPPSVAET